MPYRIGMVVGPIMLIASARSMGKSVPARFYDVEAFDEATSRRPASLGVDRVAFINDAVRAGLLVPVGDGRFYVDRARFVRRRARNWFLATFAAVLVMALFWWLGHVQSARR